MECLMNADYAIIFIMQKSHGVFFFKSRNYLNTYYPEIGSDLYPYV